jgi:3-methyladenine DNA glycosylase AlkD
MAWLAIEPERLTSAEMDRWCEDFDNWAVCIERDSTDERNFVKKGVSWALRLIGRRSQALNAACLALSRRLAESSDPTARWLGRGAVRELMNPAVRRLKG